MNLLAGFRARRLYFALAGTVVLLDQATKILAHAQLRGKPPVVLVPGVFNLIYSRNPGGLFGYFGDLSDPWRTLLLALLPLLAIVLIVVFLAGGADTDRRSLSGLGLILGGAVGNLIDRLARGEVVDFLDVYASSPAIADWLRGYFGTAHWPTFNVADSAIVSGACLLLLTLLRPAPVPDAASGTARAAGPGESR